MTMVKYLIHDTCNTDSVIVYISIKVMVSLYVNSFCAPPSATAAGHEKIIPGGFPRRSAFWMDTGGIGHYFLFSWR